MHRHAGRCMAIQKARGAAGAPHPAGGLRRMTMAPPPVHSQALVGLEEPVALWAVGGGVVSLGWIEVPPGRRDHEPGLHSPSRPGPP
eukprot:13507765-Alexandrium_andersonii.AAC.1